MQRRELPSDGGLASYWNPYDFIESQNCKFTSSYSEFHCIQLTYYRLPRIIVNDNTSLECKKWHTAPMQLKSENYPLFPTSPRLTFVNLCHKNIDSQIKHGSLKFEDYLWHRQVHKNRARIGHHFSFRDATYLKKIELVAEIEPAPSAKKAEIISIMSHIIPI